MATEPGVDGIEDRGVPVWVPIAVVFVAIGLLMTAGLLLFGGSDGTQSAPGSTSLGPATTSTSPGSTSTSHDPVARSFWMSNAEVTIDVNDDGSLSITEQLTFDFVGQFSGAYRDIRLRPGDSVENVLVSDEADSYTLGGCTQLGCESPSGTYGVERVDDFVRVVWHHQSRDQERAFKLVYTMTGVARAYDDVVDVNLEVWGDDWAVDLDHLTASMNLPTGATGGDVFVWGHPNGIEGTISVGDDLVSPTLQAIDIPAEQFVAMRVVFPRSLLESTIGATKVEGNGLDLILAEEEQAAGDPSD